MSSKPSEAELRARSILLPGASLQKEAPKPKLVSKRTTETFSADQVYKDVLGLVTDRSNSYYVALDDTPTSLEKVLIDYLNYTVNCLLVKDEVGANTPYVLLPSSCYPFTEVEVTYYYKPEDNDEELPSMTTLEFYNLRRIDSMVRQRGNSVPAQRLLQEAIKQLCIKYNLDPTITVVDMLTGRFKLDSSGWG